MPTSSQSLILQTTNGQLPPFFGRPHWRPEVPPGPEWNISEYPVSTVQLKHNFTENECKRQKFSRKPQPLQRAGSAPELSYKVDFSTLPQVLRIRGLHGSLRYDTSSKSINWKVNTIGPFYDRINNRYPGIAGKLTPATLKFFHADRQNHSVYNQPMNIPEYVFQPDFRRQVRFHETQLVGNDSEALAENKVYISLKETEGAMQMIKTNLESADYFKLIQVINQTEEYSEASRKQPLFRLEKCRPTEVGSFRLAPTEPRDVGDFKLVPPPGHIADDFRLVPSSEMHGAFVLLQSDAGNPGQFHQVQRHNGTSEEFRMVQAKIRESSPDQHKMNVIMPREAWGNIDYSPEYHGGYEYDTMHRLEDKGYSPMHNSSTKLRVSENRYNYFDDVRGQYGSVENEYTLPDISLYESHRQGVLHHQNQTSHLTDRESTFDEDLKEFNQHLEEFNKRYTENLQASSADYNRLVHLGFRKMKNEADDRKKTIANTGTSAIYQGSDWKTHNFDHWSRTTKTSREEPSSSSSSSVLDLGVTGNFRKLPLINKEENDLEEEQESLLDEVKFKANYKQWKKKKVTTMRMLKKLPPEDPTAVCVRFGDNSLSHNELKSKIENVTGFSIVSMQFDPVSVHAIDAEATSRWIIRFEDASICENLIATGIRINGVKCQVRKFEDVMKEEHDAYKFYQMMKKVTERKSQKPSSVQKDIQRPRALKTTQTQTTK